MDDWRDHASCRDWVDVFDETFDATTRMVGSLAQRMAADVCSTCPVQRPCLDDALENETAATRLGMRAGLMPRDRFRLVQRSA